LSVSERERLSVAIVETSAEHAPDVLVVLRDIGDVMEARRYGRAEVVHDEAQANRYYHVRYWADARAAERCHADRQMQTVVMGLYRIARVTHVVNGARTEQPPRGGLDDRRAGAEPDRRSGFDRRGADVGPPGEERRSGRDRRLGPRRLREQAGGVDLVAAARRAREQADAAFSGFKVGAAIETGDGTVVAGCNIENATYGLTMCAERVALFKALSDGHRVFTRVAIVADTHDPTPPCGACRQLLWEFGGNLEVTLANLTQEKGTHRLMDLLPMPFDRRLL
jgi:cytidine deaminase